MAMSTRGAPTRNLVAFCEWARASGYHVGEMPPYSTVHPVHAARSFHYDRDGKYGQAADVNWPGGGAAERTKLRVALVVAESMGLGVIYGRDGSAGAARTHQTHLHADVGSWSSYGRGDFRRRAGDLVVWDMQSALHAHRDNLWGPDVARRVNAVRLASNYHRVQHPYGAGFTQAVVGTTQDGKWGPNSMAAHDRAVAGLQRSWGIASDGVWGPQTESTYAARSRKYAR